MRPSDIYPTNIRGLSTPAVMLVACVLGAAALLAGLYFGAGGDRGRPSLVSATLYPPDFRALADFELSDQRGQTFANAQLSGSWNLMFFGYTYCPDVCPLTLATFKQIKAELAGKLPADTKLNFIFVSVDPERDTPGRLKEYMDFFDPDFIGLTDTSAQHAQLASLTRSLGVFYSKQDGGTNDAYLVDHSAGIFLINPRARAHALFSAPHRAADIVRDILAIVNSYRD
jgi:protein SCO1/2